MTNFYEEENRFSINYFRPGFFLDVNKLANKNYLLKRPKANSLNLPEAFLNPKNEQKGKENQVQSEEKSTFLPNISFLKSGISSGRPEESDQILYFSSNNDNVINSRLPTLKLVQQTVQLLKRGSVKQQTEEKEKQNINKNINQNKSMGKPKIKETSFKIKKAIKSTSMKQIEKEDAIQIPNGAIRTKQPIGFENFKKFIAKLKIEKNDSSKKAMQQMRDRAFHHRNMFKSLKPENNLKLGEIKTKWKV